MLIIMSALGIVYLFSNSGTPQTGIGIAFVFYFFANGIWNKLGAWPEGWYRIRQIPYRQLYVFTPNRRIARFLKKESELKIGSAARAELTITKEKTGEYFIPTRGEEMFDNQNGAPASLYNWDDVRPIPVFGREPDALAADGKLVPKAKIDPMLVHQAYKNDFLERRHRLNIHQSNLKWGIFGFLIALSVIFDFAIIFYTYYFGVNVNCALHTKACP